MSSPLNVAILAAGQGKRMHSAQAKVLHALAGRPIVQHVIDAMRTLSPRAMVVVVGFGADAVEQALAAPDLRFVRQDPPRGTGDATRVALSALPADGVTLVGLGDVPLVPTASLQALVAQARHGRLALLTVRMRDPSGLGRIVRNDGQVEAIVEDRDATDPQRAIDEINTGFMAAPTALLARWVRELTPHNAQNEYYLTDIVPLARRQGIDVAAEIAPDEREVGGINDRVQLATAERLVQQRRAHALMTAGVTLADPARIDIRGTLECARDVTIDVGCVFEGHVRLEEGAHVGPYCVLRDVTVGRGTHIVAFSHFNGAKIGEDAEIGPFARLRPGATLEAGVHVGNFVEIKASTLGRGAKANHLAYIGDTQVGAAVNYGAGSITANYDGANKHPTVIGDNVHVGSNCVLIAPVTIGAGATVGGGSTVVEDVPPGTLCVARARQVTIPGWKRPRKEPKG
ncbi:MAG TPA: bifunctional UDP-N-acetylglucosamine diphosphorylase/glucosamine-1-phosphate N-acetyltransferase GlmU [Casimicrobiaceae bacterium]